MDGRRWMDSAPRRGVGPSPFLFSFYFLLIDDCWALTAVHTCTTVSPSGLLTPDRTDRGGGTSTRVQYTVRQYIRAILMRMSSLSPGERHQGQGGDAVRSRLGASRCGLADAVRAPLVFLLLAMHSVFVWQGRGATAVVASAQRLSPSPPYFPPLSDTIEMARLSLLVYQFRHDTNDSLVCPQINNNPPNISNSNSTPNDWQCHWYYHNRQSGPGGGTQVMLVSSNQHRHITLVFAGTDDLQTSLVDTDVWWQNFGDGGNNWTLSHDKDVRVHAGFNSAVFGNGLMEEILVQIQSVRQILPQTHRVFITGHSLGAAAAVLTSIALTEHDYDDSHRAAAEPPLPALAASQWWNPATWRWRHRHHRHHGDRLPPLGTITTINFGCPRIGNPAYLEYLATQQEMGRLHVWRVVLGWDLVPRLPEFFWHAGHTLQLMEAEEDTHTQQGWQHDPATANRTATAYYQHYGNASLGYAGVPVGWGARSYIWVPGALESHHIRRYLDALLDWPSTRDAFVTDFARVKLVPPESDDDDDDDDEINPPLDDLPLVA